MVDPEREPLSGVVEADETIIPFRTDGGSPRRARLKVIEGFGKNEIHAFELAAVAPIPSW
jgi:hypothetical protein